MKKALNSNWGKGEMPLRLAILICGVISLFLLARLQSYHNNEEARLKRERKHQKIREDYSPMSEGKEVQEAYDAIRDENY